MNIYDALKAGSTAEDLKEAFNKELEAANARLAEEEAAALRKEVHEEALQDAREEVVNALIDYVAEVFGENFEKDKSLIDLITNALKEFENEMSSLDKFGSAFLKSFRAAKGKKLDSTSNADDAFLNTWKISWK